MATIGSLEVVVLQRNSCLICETIVNCADIVWFANRITEEVFLTSQAKSSILRTTGISDFEKCSRLISAVETQVKVAPSKYSKFISILQEEPVMQSVVTVLSESYGMLYLPLNAYVSETSVCLCGLLQLQFSLIPSPVFSQLASFCGC